MILIKNMNKRERYIALTALLFIAAAIGYNFIVEPIARQWGTLNREISSKTVTLKRDLALLLVDKTLEENYSKFSRYVRSDKSEEEAVAEFLSYIENLSRNDSCLIVNMKPIGTRDTGAYKEILVDLSSEGSVSQFTKFLYDVENTKNMILKVKHFVLTSKAGQEGALRGTFLISKVIIE